MSTRPRSEWLAGMVLLVPLVAAQAATRPIREAVESRVGER